MTFSNRLWHAIAYRLPFTPAGCTAWAKIVTTPMGKRHARTTIALSEAEQVAVSDVIERVEPDDWYLPPLLAREFAAGGRVRGAA